MSNYGSGPRYTRPAPNGPRLNTPPNRNVPRPPLNKPPNMPQQQPPRPIKPTNETTIPTPSTANPPAVRNPSAANTTDLLADSSNKSTKIPSSENASTEVVAYSSLQSSNSSVDNKPTTNKNSSEDQQRATGPVGQKRPRTEINSQQQQPNIVYDSNASSSQQQNNEKKTTTQGGRCRLFIGNVPSDLTQEEFQLLFGKYGELIEYFVNPSRGFGFIKLSSRQLAEQAKYELDGHILRGKPLRIRFASQGATIKVKNLSPNVSNELLKEAFEKYFGGIERAVVIVDDRGKSTGEGIIEFEKKPSAQKCLNECTERCFFITSELRPVIVEPWDIRDEEDGLPEKSLIHTPVYAK
jgi:RNA recognition motif-containing protein